MIDFKEKLEIERLEKAVDLFAKQMKVKLVECAKQGKRGWDNTSPTSTVPRPDGYLIHELRIDSYDWAASGPEVRNKKAIDMANRAMMLWWRHKDDVLEVKPEVKSETQLAIQKANDEYNQRNRAFCQM